MTQGLLQLATTGTVSGLQNNQAANTALAALAGMIQGGSAPTAATTGLASMAGVLWHDATNNQLKLRDQADSTFMPFATVDETNKLVLLLLRSYLAGLTLSNDGVAPNTKLDVAAGVAADDSNVAMLSLPAGGAIDCTTTGANGLDTGSLAVSTWYHAFAIGKAGGTLPALLASASLTPTLPSGYTLKRRLGSFKTDASAHIIPCVQDGDTFWWKVPTNDISGGTLSTVSRTLVTTGVPLGVNVTGIFGFELAAVNANARGLLTDPAMTDTPPGNGALSVTAPTGTNTIGGSQVLCRTNTSSQIGTRGDAAVTYNLNTHGWFDTRGRFN